MSINRMGLMERAERTMLPLKTALYLTAKRLGMDRIATTYRLQPQALYNNLNLNRTDRAPTLQQFELITEFARDHGDQEQILDALSLMTGCVWLRVPEAEDLGRTELFGEVAGLVEGVGRMCRNTQSAVADGRVDPEEVAVLERDLFKLVQAGYRLVEGAKRFGEE
ncbi:phage regulatory CII family protein [Alloalcanivorax xenomutans]|uniref:phage regulatory CII family protein n=1 Tax=Alloalcanivorax xenomutans TaxID=1094342 RepID=UPI001F1DA579|nr:phage regulatory CII family protein [Alloalcanivorax xenomutans]MCE7521946.1 hypothetical protein [Alloalcanivorax xenomutans]